MPRQTLAVLCVPVPIVRQVGARPARQCMDCSVIPWECLGVPRWTKRLARGIIPAEPGGRRSWSALNPPLTPRAEVALSQARGRLARRGADSGAGDGRCSDSDPR